MLTLNANDFCDRASDAEMIQAALDQARETGEAVVVPKINRRTGKALWEIDRTIRLYEESTLLLQNCHLRLADDAICNMFSNSNARTPLALEEEGTQSHITIRGIGSALLDGGKHNEFYESNGISRDKSKYPDHHISENCMIYMQNVSRLTIENIAIKNHRYWGICLYRTVYSRIANIHYSSESNVPNQDGVDLLKGTHDVIVENITGCVGDNIVALLTTADEIYNQIVKNPIVKNRSEGDIYNITIRNIMAYSVCGCAMIRLLNHDGYKIYNVKIDNVIETSPWSPDDAPVAQNPDLIISCDENGNPIHERYLTVGEAGYRCEAAIIIGESYWYAESKAEHGDTYGISVSNVMTHARYAVFLNNTLTDSEFSHIRLFGNAFMAVYFGEGQMSRLQFSDITYDHNCRPLAADEHIRIDWNHTESDGFSCVYLNGTKVDHITFRNLLCTDGFTSVFGGKGSGEIRCFDVVHEEIPTLNAMDGVELKVLD